MKLSYKLTKPIISAIDRFYGDIMDDSGLSIRNTITGITAELSDVMDFEGIPIPIIDTENKKLIITITTKRPGIIIGKAGKDIDALAKYLGKTLTDKDKIQINIIENKSVWFVNTGKDYDEFDYY